MPLLDIKVDSEIVDKGNQGSQAGSFKVEYFYTKSHLGQE